MITFFETESQTTLESIKEIELLSGNKFTDEYTNHLLQYNGGRCEPNIFKFLEGGEITRSRVNWFLAIYNGEYDNLQGYIEDYKIHEKRIPNSFIPIANDPFGNLICQDCINSNIYFWDHENEIDSLECPDSKRDNIHLVANNLTEFLSNLEQQ